MADRILQADGPHGPLFAAICPEVRFITPKVADYRLMAVLAAFPTEEAAREALIWAEGENIREVGR